jgi:pimeloyl-ACP methyl ester carboxylesterase
MPAYTFNLPDLGEGLLDAVVVGWLVAVGDEVERDAPLAEVETEKSAVELPSPVAGRVVELHAEPGDRVDVGRPLVTFEVADRPGIVGAVPPGERPSRRVRLRLPEEERAPATTALHVRRSEPRPGVPVLLVHGLSMSSGTWAAAGWLSALDRAGRAWLAPDLRGHGRSPKPHDPAEYGPERLVADLLGVLDAVGADEADVIGYSVGAELALELALRSPAHVRRLVAGGVGRDRPLTAEQALEVYRHAIGEAPLPAGRAGWLWAAACNTAGNDPVALSACLAGVSASGPLERLDRYPGPALLFVGTKDALVSGVEAVRDELPDAALLRIEGADHARAMFSTEAVERALAFLEA